MRGMSKRVTFVPFVVPDDASVTLEISTDTHLDESTWTEATPEQREEMTKHRDGKGEHD